MRAPKGVADAIGAGPVTLDPRQLARDADAPLNVVRYLFAAAQGDVTLVRLIRGPDIDHETVRLRRAIIWVAKFRTSASLPQIGRALNRDHSRIHRALEQAEADFVGDPDFRRLCKEIEGAVHKPVRVATAA